MDRRRHGPCAIAVLAAIAMLAACQAYQADPVDPGVVPVRNYDQPVRLVPPNLVVVLDRSGSMLDASDGNCTGGCCATAASCKWNEAVSALTDAAAGFLPRARDKVRFGLAAFPADDRCAAPGALDMAVGDPPMSADAVATAIRAMRPGGGTPTGATLEVVATTSALATVDRVGFVLLLTDGLPNCNDANHPKCDACRAGTFACRGTIDPVDGTSPHCNTTASSATACGVVGTNQCLDGGRLVNAVRALAEKGVHTFVIGFGAGTTGTDARVVLDAAAIAGREPTGGAPAYFQANSRQDLDDILRRIEDLLDCTYGLDPPLKDRELVSVRRVLVSEPTDPGVLLDSGADYEVLGPSQIRMTGQCGVLRSAPANTYALRISYVAEL